MEPAEFINLWRWSPLVRPAPEALDGVRVGEEDRDFLLRAGLPSRTETTHKLSFDSLRDGLPRLPDAAGAARGREEYARYRKIGQSVSSPVCLDESEGGRVVVVYVELGQLAFVNSGVVRLAASLLAVEGTVRRFLEGELSHDSFADRDRAAAQLRAELERIDAPAVAEGTVWGQFLDELEPLPQYFEDDDEEED